jgi:cell division protein FtsB
VRWDRVGRIALTLVLVAVLYSYLNPVIDFVKTYTGTTAAKAEFHEKLRENKRLHKRIQTADDSIVIARKARAQGMVAEGETPIVVQGLDG